MPVWHVSVAFHPTTYELLSVDQMRVKMIREGHKLALTILQGVGAGRIAFKTPGGSAIHVQAALLPDEIAALPKGWMDIQAVDERGPCIVLKV